MSRKIGVLALLLLAALLVSGCEDPRVQILAQAKSGANNAVTALRSSLSGGQIANAEILKTYAEKLSAQKPEMTSIADLLALEATTQGKMFESIQQRLSAINANPELVGSTQAQIGEYQSIARAASPYVFGKALADPINVIADLSDGALPRIDSPTVEKEQEMAGLSGEPIAASQMIGNPNYGHWTTGSNGMSVWEWYGMYAMFRDITGGPVTYDSWNSRRSYGYYNDVGRDAYGSYRERTSAYKPSKPRYSSEKSFQAAKQRASAYGSQSGSSSSSQRASSYSSSGSSSNSGYSGTFRSSGGSRSISFGK